MLEVTIERKKSQWKDGETESTWTRFSQHPASSLERLLDGENRVRPVEWLWPSALLLPHTPLLPGDCTEESNQGGPDRTGWGGPKTPLAMCE